MRACGSNGDARGTTNDSVTAAMHIIIVAGARALAPASCGAGHTPPPARPPSRGGGGLGSAPWSGLVTAATRVSRLLGITRIHGYQTERAWSPHVQTPHHREMGVRQRTGVRVSPSAEPVKSQTTHDCTVYCGLQTVATVIGRVASLGYWPIVVVRAELCCPLPLAGGLELADNFPHSSLGPIGLRPFLQFPHLREDCEILLYHVPKSKPTPLRGAAC